MQKIDKITTATYWVFRILLVIAGVLAAMNSNWENLGLVALTFILTLAPPYLEKKIKIDFPSEAELALLVFIFLSMYLGEVHAFYAKVWWWDLMLHGVSGLLIADIGYIIVFLLNRKKRLKLSPLLIAIFTLSFAMTIGVLWEIFEYAVDSILGLNMQKSGLQDTMWDLIFALFGALIISFAQYLYLTRNLWKKSIRAFEKKLIESNKRFFE